MTLAIIEPGLQTLVVDQGRFGSRHQGLPWSGPADWVSFLLCNSILGNQPNTPALEFSLVGPTLKASRRLALSHIGPPCNLEIDGHSLNGLNSFTLNPGETLKVGSCSSGVCGYIGIKGGITPKSILGSNCSLSAIKAKTKLACSEGWCMRTRLPEEWLWQNPKGEVRVTPGAEFASFKSKNLFNEEFMVEQSSNRMGLRLSGKEFSVPEGEMVSEPVCPGTVQVSRNGHLLVLGMDGQTIGGYPRIAQVIRADLDILGQLRPGRKVTFTLVSEEEAEFLWQEKSNHFSSVSMQLCTASGLFL